MTLETKINHEPLLNYLKRSFAVMDNNSPFNQFYFISGPSLIHVEKKGTHTMCFGDKDYSRSMPIYATKESQLGWYSVDSKVVTIGSEKALQFDFIKIGSKESYGLAMKEAAKKDELEFAAVFRDLGRVSQKYDSLELLEEPKRSRAPLFIAGAMALALAAFGIKKGIESYVVSVVQEQSQKTMRSEHGHLNNLLLKQSLQEHIFPEGVTAKESIYQYNPATKNVPANYAFVIEMKGKEQYSLVLLLDEKTGALIHPIQKDVEIIKKYGLESVIERLQKGIKLQ